ncbi:MAG: hypothetical protein AABY14_03540 [Nanoarchaeota archaeon]
MGQTLISIIEKQIEVYPNKRKLISKLIRNQSNVGNIGDVLEDLNDGRNKSLLFDLGLKTINEVLIPIPKNKDERFSVIKTMYINNGQSPSSEDEIKQDIRDVGVYIYERRLKYHHERRLILVAWGLAVGAIGLSSLFGIFSREKNSQESISEKIVYKNKEYEVITYDEILEKLENNPNLLSLTTRISFDTALRDSTKRQLYLDEIYTSIKNYIPLCGGIVYGPNADSALETTLKAIIDSNERNNLGLSERSIEELFSDVIFQKQKIIRHENASVDNGNIVYRGKLVDLTNVILTPKIYVSDLLFKEDREFSTTDDVISVIKNHEYKHIIDIWEKTFRLNNEIVIPIMDFPTLPHYVISYIYELRADYYQLSKIVNGEQRVSEQAFMKDIADFFFDYQGLKRYAPQLIDNTKEKVFINQEINNIRQFTPAYINGKYLLVKGDRDIHEGDKMIIEHGSRKIIIYQ